MPFDSELHESMHRDFTGTKWTETIRRQRQRKRLNAWMAECRRADKRDLETTAVLYARWLAERDGIKLAEDARGFCQLALVRDDDGIARNRVHTVTFEGGAKIDIPHWDFVPRVIEFVDF